MRSLPLPDGSQQCAQLFADDNSNFLVATPNNVEEILRVYEDFSTVSRSRINNDKTTAIWVSFDPRLPWTEEYGFIWVDPGSTTRYLGCPIYVGITWTDWMDWCLQRFKSKIEKWSGKIFSFLTRTVICNHILVASVVFVLLIFPFAKNSLGNPR